MTEEFTRGFLYEQSSGQFAIVNGDFECPLDTGAAGREDGLNNPQMERVRGIGPLPRGQYLMRVVAHSRFAAPAIQLTFAPETRMETYGRSGFYIHGGTKSEGCILLQRPTRVIVAAGIAAGFDKLWVVS